MLETQLVPRPRFDELFQEQQESLPQVGPKDRWRGLSDHLCSPYFHASLIAEQLRTSRNQVRNHLRSDECMCLK